MPSVMQSVGTPNARHNFDNEYRKHLDNVDPELSQYNEVVRRKSVEEIYNEHLQPAFESFNEKQKRKSRRLDVKYGVSTYLEYQRTMDKKARASANAIDQKGRPPIREIVWQFGNPEQGFGCRNQTEEQRELAKKLLLEAQAEAERRYPQLKWGDTVFHADETSVDADGREHGSFHLHAAFVPICLNNKQGPKVQVAFERCLAEMGFISFNAWKHDLDNIMEEVLKKHDMERTLMDNHESHVKATEFHKQQRVILETRALEAQKAEQEKQIDELQAEIEDLEKKKNDADGSADDAEQRAIDEERRASEAAERAQKALIEAEQAEQAVKEVQRQLNALQAPKDVDGIEGKRSWFGRSVKLSAPDYEVLKEYAHQSAAAVHERREAIRHLGNTLNDLDEARAAEAAANAAAEQYRQAEIDQTILRTELKHEISELESKLRIMERENRHLKEHLKTMTEIAQGESGLASKLIQLLPSALSDKAAIALINKATGLDFESPQQVDAYRRHAESKLQQEMLANDQLLDAKNLLRSRSR